MPTGVYTAGGDPFEPPLVVIGLSNCLKGLSEWHNGEAYHLEMLQAEWNADDSHAIEKAYHEIH